MTVAALERPKLPCSLPRYIERDDAFARLLAAAATPDEHGRHVWPERDIALAAVLADTGIRASELCGLRIRDLVLDVEDPYVRVTGKGGAVRDCPSPARSPPPSMPISRAAMNAPDGTRGGTTWSGSTAAAHRSPPTTLDYHVRRWFSRGRGAVAECRISAAHAIGRSRSRIGSETVEESTTVFDVDQGTRSWAACAGWRVRNSAWRRGEPRSMAKLEIAGCQLESGVRHLLNDPKPYSHRP
jgi:hypothetical protein